MKKAKISVGLLAVLMAAVVLFSACAGSASSSAPASAPAPSVAPSVAAPASEAEKPVKVFVGVGTGGLGDGGYNDAAHAGGLQAEKELGIEMQVYEPKSLSEIEAQYLAAAESGEYGLIIGVGYDNASGVDKASEAYPDQKFVIIQSVFDKPNVVSANLALEGAAYEIGALVATLYKENLLPGVPEGTHSMGLILGMAGGEITQQKYSIIAGGKSVDPDFELLDTEVGSWSDQAKAKELAVALFEKGCGVVFHYAGSAGHGVFEAAKETGGYVIGAHGNQNSLADTVVFSLVEDMQALVFQTIKTYVDGDFKAGSIRYGLAENVVYLTFDGSKVELPDSVKALMEEMTAKLNSGEIKPPISQEELDAFIAAK